MQNATQSASRFRHLAVAGAALALMLSTTSFSFAQSGPSYLVQLGQYDSQEAARTQWDSLQKAHPQQLGNLSLRVVPVRSGGKDVFRAQGAGIASYAQAQSICTDLSVASVNCAIVETSMYQPEEEALQASAAAPTAAKEGGFASWLGFGGDDEVEAPQQPKAAAELPVVETSLADRAPDTTITPLASNAWQDAGETTAAARADANAARTDLAALAPRNLAAEAPAAPAAVAPVTAPAVLAPAAVEAPDEFVEIPSTPQVSPEQISDEEVQVAEAVQVPVSSFNAPQDQPVVIANRPVGYGGFPSQPATAAAKNAPWLQIGQFASREAAFAFSRELSRTNAEVMQFTRVRIIGATTAGRGYAARQAERTSMRLGPLGDQNQVNSICDTAKQNGLSCSLVNEIGASSTAANDAPRSRTNPATAYGARRDAVNRGYNRTPGFQQGGAFWAQLGAFDSPAAAQQQWSFLQQTHSDLLKHLSPQVSYPALSSSAAPVYHLRTGPFVAQVSAYNLCESLRTRRLGCVVVQGR